MCVRMCVYVRECLVGFAVAAKVSDLFVLYVFYLVLVI